MSEISVLYGEQVYVLPLTYDPNAFYIKSQAGSQIAVSSITAATLFAAESAVLLLQRLHGQGGVNQLPPAWDAVIASALGVLARKGVANALAGIDGSLVVGALTLGTSIAALAPTAVFAALAPGAINQLGSATLGIAPSLADLALVYKILLDAKGMLAEASRIYQSIISTTGPIPIGTIAGTINDTLLAVNLGSIATAAAQQIPGVQGNFLDDLIDFASSFLSSLVHLAATAKSVVNLAAGSLQDIATIGDTVGDHIDAASSAVDQSSFAIYLESGLSQAISSSIYQPFTGNGILASKAKLSNSPSVLRNTPGTQFAISSDTPLIAENSGGATFTISRSDTSHSDVLYISTVPDLGTSNPNQNYYYQGLKSVPVTLNPGISTATIKLTVNDLGLTTGSETFRIIAQHSTSDPTATYLATDNFTIVNNDTLPGTFQFSPNPVAVKENAGAVWFTLTRSAPQHAATVYISTIHDQQPAENPGGNYYYKGILNMPVTFCAGQSTVQVQLIVNDLGLTSGSESFRLVAQKNPEDPNSASLASTKFTINNSDGSPGGGGNAASVLTVQSQPLSLQTGTTATITANLLTTTDSAYVDPQQLRYVIVTPPSYGSLLLNGSVDVSTFTQADINSGHLEYQESQAGTTSDGFTYEVIDPAGYHTPVASYDVEVFSPVVQPPPQAPTLTIHLANDTGISSTDGVTSDPTISGTADPNGTVALSETGSVIASFTANASGSWTYAAAGLSQGLHFITASETNAANLTTSAFLAFALDTVPPQGPTVPGLPNNATDTPLTTPTLSGTTSPSDNDVVQLMEGTTIIGRGPSVDGTWNISTTPLSVGVHNITAIAVDQAGNMTSSSAPATFNVIPPPTGEVILNDAFMANVGNLSVKGTITDGTGTLTEYGAISANGFTITNPGRSSFALMAWDPIWAFPHDVGGQSEYYDGADVLIVPADGLLSTSSTVPATVSDTIHIGRTDGGAFSLRSIDLGQTGNSVLFAVFTGVNVNGSKISETIDFSTGLGPGLRTVAFTGFDNVTDVALTANPGEALPVGVQFDNIMLGSPQPPASPPLSEQLTAPLTLDDADMVAAGEVQLVSTDLNAFNLSTYSQFGPISSHGFSVSDIDNTSFSFNVFSAKFAQVNGYTYDGPDVFVTSWPDTIAIKENDSSPFDFLSIALDCVYQHTGELVTFTGKRSDSTTITQTVSLDSASGMQVFAFGSTFNSVVSISFTTNGNNVLFDSLSVGPATSNAPPPPSGLTLSPAFDTGIIGDDITEATNFTISGTGQPADDLTLLDGGTIAALAVVDVNGAWTAATGSLTPGRHNFTAIEANTTNKPSTPSAALAVQIQLPHILSWIGKSDTSFGNSLNWNDVSESILPAQTPPDVLDTIEFESSNGGISGTGTVAATKVGSPGNGVLELDGGASLVTGSLGGGVLATDIGEIGLTGVGTDLSVTGVSTVGDGGVGALSVINGATFNAASLDEAAAPGSDGAVSVIGAGSALNIGGLLSVGDQSSGSLNIANGASVTIGGLAIGTGASGSGNVVIGPGSHLTLTGTSINVGIAGSAVLDIQGGTLGLVPGTTLSPGTFGRIVQVGGLIDPATVFDASGGSFGGGGTAEALGTIVNSSLASVSGGAETLLAPLITSSDPVNVAGDWSIKNSGTLVLDVNTFDNSQTISFGDLTGVLTIGQQVTLDATQTPQTIAASALNGFAAPIVGYKAGDKITFAGLSVASDSVIGNVVTLFDSGSNNLGSLTFQTGKGAPDNAGATAAKAQIVIPCFAAGTRIATAGGPCAVESLRKGDLMVTRGETCEPIIWIGQRAVDCTRHPRPKSVWPVCVRAGAFGTHLPTRDLYLSPDHAVFLNEVLVPVKLLINGTTIVQVKRDRVRYFHVELSRHAVILAEGLMVESYLDLGDRANFGRSGETIRLFPDFATRPAPETVLAWETRGAAPLVLIGAKLEAARVVIAVNAPGQDSRSMRAVSPFR